MVTMQPSSAWVTSTDEAGYQAALAKGLGEPPAGWDAIDPKTGAPVGIDKGWDYAPGANTDTSFAEFISQKLINLDAPIGAAMWRELAPVVAAERDLAWNAWLDEIFGDQVKRRRISVVGAISQDTLAWLAARPTPIIPASSEIAIEDAVIVGKKAVRHIAAGDALTHDEWRTLPDLLDHPAQVLFDTRSSHLIYVLDTGDRAAKITVEFDYRVRRTKELTNLIVSVFKTPDIAIEGEIKGKLFEVIQ